MKTIIRAVLVLFSSSQALCSEILRDKRQKEQPVDTTVLTQILSLPLSTFIGKPVDSLLSVLPNSYTLRSFMISKVGYTKGIIQAYSTNDQNDCHIEIFIDSFQFQTFPNYNRSTWSMALARQETISFIRIMKGNNSVCLYGCNNPQYYYLD
jgi:hypothetical protein